MRTILAITLMLTLFACATQQRKPSEFAGLSFSSLNGIKVAVFDQVENLQLAYVDRKDKQFKAIKIAPDNYSSKPLNKVQLSPTGASFDAGLVVPVQDDRFIIVQYPPDPIPILICEETHDPCALNGTLGCGGGFKLGVDAETTKDLLQTIIESNEDSGTSLCGPAEGGIET